MRILVVEDEVLLAYAVGEVLRAREPSIPPRRLVRCERPAIAVRLDRNDAGRHFERDTVAASVQAAHDVRRTERRMARERHLERRRENPHPPAGLGTRRRQEKGRFRQIEL